MLNWTAPKCVSSVHKHFAYLYKTIQSLSIWTSARDFDTDFSICAKASLNGPFRLGVQWGSRSDQFVHARNKGSSSFAIILMGKKEVIALL